MNELTKINKTTLKDETIHVFVCERRKSYFMSKVTYILFVQNYYDRSLAKTKTKDEEEFQIQKQKIINS